MPAKKKAAAQKQRNFEETLWDTANLGEIPTELASRAEVLSSYHTSLSSEGSANAGFPAAFQFTEEIGWVLEGRKVWHLAKEEQLTMRQLPYSNQNKTEGNGFQFHQGVTNLGTGFSLQKQFSTGGDGYAEDNDVLSSVRAPVGRVNLADRKLVIGRGLAALGTRRVSKASSSIT